MNIDILSLKEGASEAKGLAVIIDVFRAFTVEAYLAKNNAERIIPVSSVDFAYKYKKEHPHAVLCGERDGKIIDGFDFGNSPSQIENTDFSGKTVIHTTSAGTQGIANAKNADEIIGGSLVNAKAIATYIKMRNPQTVSLVCMGLAGEKDTQEDLLCAQYIKSLLQNEPLRSLEHRIATLKYTDGAKFFDPLQQNVFPERDFHLSTAYDSFDFVLKLEKDELSGLEYMKKIDIEYPQKTEQITKVLTGDMLSSFSRDEALLFPLDVKASVAYGEYKEPDGIFDAALILGCNPTLLKSRAQAAAKLYHEKRCSLFIPTGGVKWETEFGYISECEAIRRYLIDMGVPEELISSEATSTTTKENFECSKRILSKITNISKARIAVVTSRFHIRRSIALSKYYIPEAEICGISASYLNDDPTTFAKDPNLIASVTTECRCLLGNVKQGIIPDFPVI